MIANRVSVLVAAALFVAASFLNASADERTAPTTIVLSQPAQTLDSVASNR
jgi:hypothetical protein